MLSYLLSYKLEVSSRRKGLPKGHYQLNRKYHDFEWLHLDLQYHFPGVIVPVLPADESLFEFGNPQILLSNRIKSLENYINMVASHPELGISTVFITFMDADDSRLASAIQESKSSKRSHHASNADQSVSWQRGIDYSIAKVTLKVIQFLNRFNLRIVR